MTITNPWTLFKTSKPKKGCTISGKSTFLCGLHRLVIREHFSGLAVFDMALHYTQDKHTKF